MLNYIWFTLLLLGIVTAVVIDLSDSATNKYRNGKPLYVLIKFNNAKIDSTKSSAAKMIISKTVFNDFYQTKLYDDVEQNIKLTYNHEKKSFASYLEAGDYSPSVWKEMAKINGKETDLSGTVVLREKLDSVKYTAAFYTENISFVKMKEVTGSAIDYAASAVKIALGLIGIMALWLGIMKIAEQAGLISIIAKGVRPITKFLFPDVPQDHPAIGSMIMNISANMLGLGNAATPFGLKAMEELNSINPDKGTATNAMCTFLAINTAGLTIIPATAIAVRAAAGSSDPAIIIGTSFFGALCATSIGILSAKILEKFSIPNFNFIGWIKGNIKIIAGFLLLLYF